MYVISPRKMFRQIIQDLKRKKDKAEIAYKFHLGIAEMMQRTCLILRRETRINQVVLSGGVFQNNLLLRLSLDLLYRKGFAVFAPRNLSSNDSGISLGQAVIAGERG